MRTSIGNAPAYPVHEGTNPDGYSSGISTREYFAAIAMQGLLSNPTYQSKNNLKQMAQHATVAADKLINELNNQS